MKLFWSKSIGHGFRIGGKIGGNKGGKKNSGKGCLTVFLVFLALSLVLGGFKACFGGDDEVTEQKKTVAEESQVESQIREVPDLIENVDENITEDSLTEIEEPSEPKEFSEPEQPEESEEVEEVEQYEQNTESAPDDIPVVTPAPEPVKEVQPEPQPEPEPVKEIYIVNTNTQKIHKQNCRHVSEIEEHNKSSTTDPYSLITQGYTWCGTCCRGMK